MFKNVRMSGHPGCFGKLSSNKLQQKQAWQEGFTDDFGDELSGLIDGIHYRVEGDVNLSSFAALITEVPAGADRTAIQLGLPALSSGRTYRTFRAPNSVPTAFIRAKISETP